MDNLQKERIRGLLLKGFTRDEIANLLKIKEEDIEDTVANMPLQQNSTELYSELQKDLSKLVLTELNKPERDANVILNSIKLQAELQEKKLNLNKLSSVSKANKDYIYERDDKIYELWKQKGSNKNKESCDSIAREFGISKLSVEQAIDRVELNLPDELKTIPPSIIAETKGKGIDRETRLKILWEAFNNKLTRKQVREMMIKLKGDFHKV